MRAAPARLLALLLLPPAGGATRRPLPVNDSAWTFVGGPWSTAPDAGDPLCCASGDTACCPGATDVIVPSVELADRHLAVLTSRAFQLSTAAPTLSVDFDWRAELYWTAPALLLGTDATHFLEVSFPVAGQQYRAEHSWLLVARVNATSGWREGISYTMLNGLSSAITVWHSTTVEVSRGELIVSVDGIVRSSVAVDVGPRPFHIGLSTYDSYGPGAPWPGAAWPATSRFRSLAVSGEHLVEPVWDHGAQHVSPWRAIPAAINPTGVAGGRIMRHGSKLLMANGQDGLLTSTDSIGSEWVNATAQRPQGTVLRARKDGRLEGYALKEGEDPKECQLIRSVAGADGDGDPTDDDVVWRHSWPWLSQCPNTAEGGGVALMLPLRNGSLVIVLTVMTNQTTGQADELIGGVLGGPNVTMNVSTPQFHNWSTMTFPTGRSFMTGKPPYSLAFAIVSHTNGDTWESLQPLDGPPYPTADDSAPFPPTPYIPKYDYMSELYGTELADGSLLSFIRPGAAPAMWQAFAPAGKSFGPMTRGMAPMYACAMLTTASGVVLVGGRHPGLALLASWDDAMTWSTYSVDTASWSQGAMLEVAADVILWVYGGRCKISLSRFACCPSR